MLVFLLRILALSAVLFFAGYVLTPGELGDSRGKGCLITNDFYAVHFNAYLQPPGGIKEGAGKWVRAYCRELPDTGDVFFSMDLIDRDIRKIPITVRLVEVEQTGKNPPEDFREIRIITEVPERLYKHGIIEAQATLDKKGHYMLMLLVGDVMSDDDKIRIPLAVGVNPYQQSMPIMVLIVVVLMVVIGLLVVAYRYFFKFRVTDAHNNIDHIVTRVKEVKNI